MKKQKHIAYYRVSTQGQSLGLDAQKAMVRNYLKDKWPPIASYQEKESGKNSTRPELIKALDHCKKEKATLVISSLDRLSRDLNFITLLQKQKVTFVVADMPHANKLTIQLFGALAEYERECISKRTSRALQALKDKGVKLGSLNPKTRAGLNKRWKKLREEKRKKQKQVRTTKGKVQKPVVRVRAVDIADQNVLPMIKTFRKQRMSYVKIAQALNEAKVKTRQDGIWTHTQVHRIASRHGL